MKLMVTGTKGQVARSLIEAGPAYEIRAVTVGRPDLDLTQPDSISKTLKETRPDVVINAAAYTAVDRAEVDVSTAVSVNHHGAGILAKTCHEHDIPIVHLSTDYVFDGSKQTPYAESDPTAPLGVYGESKRDGEEAVIAANPRHLILRTAWVYSPFGHNFVKTMLHLAKTHTELAVVNDQIGSPTYAPHLANAILSVCKHVGQDIAATRWGIYHAAGSGETTWYGMACELFSQAAGNGSNCPVVKPITFREYPTPAPRPANSRLDCRKLKQQFGICLPDWQQGIKDCLGRLQEKI